MSAPPPHPAPHPPFQLCPPSTVHWAHPHPARPPLCREVDGLNEREMRLLPHPVAQFKSKNSVAPLEDTAYSWNECKRVVRACHEYNVHAT